MNCDEVRGGGRRRDKEDGRRRERKRESATKHPQGEVNICASLSISLSLYLPLSIYLSTYLAVSLLLDDLGLLVGRDAVETSFTLSDVASINKSVTPLSAVKLAEIW